MEYSHRIAKVLTPLRDSLELKEYLKLLKRLQKAKQFKDLNKKDQQLIIKIESGVKIKDKSGKELIIKKKDKK